MGLPSAETTIPRASRLSSGAIRTSKSETYRRSGRRRLRLARIKVIGIPTTDVAMPMIARMSLRLTVCPLVYPVPADQRDKLPPRRRPASSPLHATTYGPRAVYEVPGIPGPERPRRRQTAADRNPRYDAAWLSRRAPQLVAGRLPAQRRSRALGAVCSLAAPRASRCPRQPMGVGLVAAKRQRQRRPGARSAARAARFGPP
jgi:hypothetical protein